MTPPITGPGRGRPGSPRWLSALVLLAVAGLTSPRARAEVGAPGEAPSLPEALGEAETKEAPAPPPGEPLLLAPPPPPALSPAPAAAAPALVAVARAPEPRHLVPSLSHQSQLGLAVLLGAGYRGIFPYHDDVSCGDAKAGDAARVCTNRAPTFIDLQPSLALGGAWDLLLDVRLGLERDFNTRRQLFLMPGFRYWMDPQRRVKFFTTVQLAYDRSDQNTPRVDREDLGLRNSNGVMVELMRNFGAYLQFGETVGFVRWLSFTVDAGLGVQARYP